VWALIWTEDNFHLQMGGAHRFSLMASTMVRIAAAQALTAMVPNWPVTAPVVVEVVWAHVLWMEQHAVLVIIIWFILLYTSFS
jgi:hypothetical protein